MDVITRTEFDELVSDDGGLRISLFAPTHRVSGPKEGDADRLRWKNLLNALQDTLVEDGHARRDVDELLTPAWELHGDAMAWSHMADGLAMFLRPGWHATYRLPLDLPELATVGTEFVLTPTLPLLTDRNYAVLALSQNNVRVLRGGRDRIIEIDLPDVPESFDDVFERPDPQGSPRAAAGSGKDGPTYHGGGALDNVRQEDVLEFFREVARGIEDYLAGRTVPLILAGLPEWHAAYREVSSYPHLVEDGIRRNPDDLSADDLRAAAWQLVEARLAEENAGLLDRFHEQRARGGGAIGLHEVAQAAREGRVDTLLMSTEVSHADGTNGARVLRASVDAGDDWVRAGHAAQATLRMGGAVRVLDTMPDGAPIAAILRY